MTWEDFRDRTGLTIAEMATLFDVSPRTVNSWIGEESPGRRHQQLRRDQYLNGSLVIAFAPEPRFYRPEDAPAQPDKMLFSGAYLNAGRRVLTLFEDLPEPEKDRVRRKICGKVLTGTYTHELLPAMDLAINTERHVTAPLDNPKRINMLVEADLIDFMDDYARELSEQLGRPIRRSEVFRGLARSLRDSVTKS